MALPSPTLFNPSTHNTPTILSQLARIHGECILSDNQLATFLPDQNGQMDQQKLLKYWQDLAHEVSEGKTHFIVLQFTDDSQTELAGYVALYMPPGETGPFRATVKKLMVSPSHRMKGVARRLMAKLEDEAVKRGRYLLVLDTSVGSPAEKVYPRLGYRAWGVIPKYGISPRDGTLVDEVWFYKDLRDVDPGSVR